MRDLHQLRGRPLRPGASTTNFATNKWVYLYYSPQTVTERQAVRRARSSRRPRRTRRRRTRPRRTTAWDPVRRLLPALALQVRRRRRTAPRLDLSSEQQILRVTNNRQECCHVAGDIDFDKHNNLWMVTGDDTPAGGINANGYGPFEDQLTDEQQTVRATNATGGTFTLTFNGQTTAPIAYNATAAQIDAALEALSNIGANNIQTSGGPANTANVNVFFRRALQQSNQTQITANGAGLTGTTRRRVANDDGAGGRLVPAPDRRRPPLDAEHQRPARQDPAHQGQGQHHRRRRQQGRHSAPAPARTRSRPGNLYPLVARRPAGADAAPRSTRWASATRSASRSTRTTSPTSPTTRRTRSTPQRSRGPSGVGRLEIVRKPANYGYPLCYTRDARLLQVELPRVRAGHDDGRHPAATTRRSRSTAAARRAAQRLALGARRRPGLRARPAPTRRPVTDPDIWYSYRDNNAATPLGTPCVGYYAPTPGPDRAGLDHRVPAAVPGALHGRRRARTAPTKYHYDPANPNTEEVPGRTTTTRSSWASSTQDTLREIKLDSQNRVFRDQQLPGLRRRPTSRTPRVRRSSATTRWTCSSAPTARSTC